MNLSTVYMTKQTISDIVRSDNTVVDVFKIINSDLPQKFNVGGMNNKSEPSWSIRLEDIRRWLGERSDLEYRFNIIEKKGIIPYNRSSDYAGELPDILKGMNNKQIEMLTDALLSRRVALSFEYANENRKMIRQVQDDVNRKFSDLTDSMEALTDKQFWISKVNASKEYFAPKYLAQQNNPSFSSQRMNMLLEYCGIIQFNKEPYSQHLQGNMPLAVKDKVVRTSGYEGWQYKFHAERTWKVIKRVLSKRGMLSGFESCKTKSEIDSFIDNLYQARKAM